MINIVVAMHLWCTYWKNSEVIIYCDNEACVQVVTTSKTRDKFLAACVRNVWLITATYDISLQIRHIRGEKNIVADTLSRVYSNKNVNHTLLQHLQQNYLWEIILPEYFNLDLHI